MSVDAPIDLGVLPRSAVIDDRRPSRGRRARPRALAGEFGTPLFVYDEDELRARCRDYASAFGADAVAYAGKAFLCGAMARLVAEEGLHLDVATGGELHVAHRAGFPPARMVFHGNNKSDRELRMALDARGRPLVVDSFDELDRIEALVAIGLAAPTRARARDARASRRTPTSTSRPAPTTRSSGSPSSTGAARDAAVRVAKSDAMELVGLPLPHRLADPRARVVPRAARSSPSSRPRSCASPVSRSTEINLGGGLGVPYTSDDRDAPSIAQYAAFVRTSTPTRARRAGLDPAPRLTVEAGPLDRRARRASRSTRSAPIKEIPGVRTYVAVDGGMSDNPRPVTYGARYEAFVPARAHAPRPCVVTRRGQALRAGRHAGHGRARARRPRGRATCSRPRSPARTATRWRRTTTWCRARRSCSSATAAARVVVRRETFEDLVARDATMRRLTASWHGAGTGRDARLRERRQRARAADPRARRRDRGALGRAARGHARRGARPHARTAALAAAGALLHRRRRERGRRSRRRHRRRGHRRHRAGRGRSSSRR